jgi:hypothetical protein
MGMVVPPQVTSVSGKPLTIAFEEISASKATYHRIEPGEEDGTDVLAEGIETDGLLGAVDLVAEMAADGDVVAVAEVTTDDAVADLAPEAAAEATELPADQ